MCFFLILLVQSIWRWLKEYLTFSRYNRSGTTRTHFSINISSLILLIIYIYIACISALNCPQTATPRCRKRISIKRHAAAVVAGFADGAMAQLPMATAVVPMIQVFGGG